MTRYEKIKSMGKMDLAYYLCYLHDCTAVNNCPVKKQCRERVNGYIPYMEEPENYERMMSMSLEEMANFLCDWHEENNLCEVCPAAHLCKPTQFATYGISGFVSWLKRDVTNEPSRNTPIV